MEVILLADMRTGLKVKVARTAREWRQSDVAFVATEELHRQGFKSIRVTPANVGAFETGLYVERRRRAAILAVLGLSDA